MSEQMMITITGNVQYEITLDPGVWIFDERKVDLHTHFTQQLAPREIEEKKFAEAWDRHRVEGTKLFTNDNRSNISRNEFENTNYGIPLEPFLTNASPNED